MVRKWETMYYLRKIGGFSLVALLAVVPSLAFAEGVLTSQAYVDAQDNLKVSIHQTTGTNNSNVGKTLVVDSSGDLVLDTIDALPLGSANRVLQYNGTNSAWESVDMDAAPTQSSVKPVTSGGVYNALQSATAVSNFVENAINSNVTDKAPAEQAVYNALNAKQDKIPANSFTADGTSYPSLVATTDSAGTVGEIGLYNYNAALGGDTSMYAGVASDLGVTVADLTEMDSMVPSMAIFAAMEQEVDRKQNKQIGAAPVDTNSVSTDAGKILVVGNDGKIAVGVAVDTTPTQSSNNMVTSGGVYDYAVPVHYGAGTNSANVGKGLIVDSSGDLALSNILQAIANPTTAITNGAVSSSNDGYVVRSVVVNADGKTINVTRDTVKIPVAAGAPSSSTPTDFAEVWVQ